MAKSNLTYEQFMDRIRHDAGGCWLWEGRRDLHGYGRIKQDGKEWLAHRLMWTFTNGPIEPTRHVLHSCDNPPCVRPDHLFLGDPQLNALDMAKKGRGYKSPSGLPYGAHKICIPNLLRSYHSRVTFKGKTYSLGNYYSAQEASETALRFKEKLYLDLQTNPAKA